MIDVIINKELKEENLEVINNITKSLSKIDNFNLEISKIKINKKFKKYSKIYNKMLSLQMKLFKSKNELDKSFKEVNNSVSIIKNVNQIKKYIKDGDSLLISNSRLSKLSYNKALRLSEKLLEVSITDEEDIDYIKDKINIADSIYSTKYVKDTIRSINEFLEKSKDLDKVINRLSKVDFNKMDKYDLSKINILISNVLDKRPSQLGNLVKSLKSNTTNNNLIEFKLIQIS